MISNLKIVAEKLARRHGLHMNDAEVMVKDVLDIITEEIVNKGGFMYRGNFTITKKLRRGKKGRVNGKEYVDKVEYLSKTFKDTDGNALFDIDRVYGVVSNENKVEVINALLEEDDVVFFDDTIGILNEVIAKCNSVCQYYHCLALHSTALYMRTMEDIVSAFETETHENYPR